MTRLRSLAPLGFAAILGCCTLTPAILPAETVPPDLTAASLQVSLEEIQRGDTA